MRTLETLLVYATVAAVLIGLAVNVAGILWNVLVVSEALCPSTLGKVVMPPHPPSPPAPTSLANHRTSAAVSSAEANER